MDIINSRYYLDEINIIAKDIPIIEGSVLVTGASGMIGSVFIDSILMSNREYGNKITVFALGRNKDRLSARFSYAKDNKDLHFVVQDVTDPLLLDDPVDYIVHLASNTDPVAYSLYPAETLLTNIYGTKNLLDYCKEHKRTRILGASSFEVYGKIPNQDVYKEEDSGEIDLNQVRSCYPESKKCSEILMRCYQKEHDVDFVIARLCSIYGPTMSQSDSKAHAQFIRNGVSHNDIVLKSKGLQRRTYCYVMDAVSALLYVLFKGHNGEVYNISNEKSIATIAEVAHTVAEICHTEVVYDFPDNIEQEGYSRPQNCILDNSKLKSLGWTGGYDLEKGLRSTIDIIRDIIK